MKILLFVTGLTFSSLTYARCDLPRGEKLTIACTEKCDFATRSRLKIAGLRLGYPVKVIHLKQLGEISESLKKTDAVLIPGGADINPSFYLDDVTPELSEYTRENLHLVKFTEEGRRRDEYEHSVVQHYSQNDEFKTLPLLGICRGMQMMSVAQGIPLYLDIKTELGIPNRIWKFDRIHVRDENSLMSSFYGRKKVKGLELHHQGIRVDYYKAHQNDYPLTKVSAYSNNDQVAEAIEYTHRPALGVQYHPEKSFPKTSFPVFKWFLTKACEHKISRKDQL